MGAPTSIKDEGDKFAGGDATDYGMQAAGVAAAGGAGYLLKRGAGSAVSGMYGSWDKGALKSSSRAVSKGLKGMPKPMAEAMRASLKNTVGKDAAEKYIAKQVAKSSMKLGVGEGLAWAGGRALPIAGAAMAGWDAGKLIDEKTGASDYMGINLGNRNTPLAVDEFKDTFATKLRKKQAKQEADNKRSDEIFLKSRIKDQEDEVQRILEEQKKADSWSEITKPPEEKAETIAEQTMSVRKQLGKVKPKKGQTQGQAEFQAATKLFLKEHVEQYSDEDFKKAQAVQQEIQKSTSPLSKTGYSFKAGKMEGDPTKRKGSTSAAKALGYESSEEAMQTFNQQAGAREAIYGSTGDAEGGGAGTATIIVRLEDGLKANVEDAAGVRVEIVHGASAA
jgi:hypothetical protein